ncbi:fasciclin domain-containing protein [Crocosphaera chwakensis]|uniref:Fasciclin domain protein n=1 Tax=Crocosphaera chwakensis CCY0110 TaxID=391612 RepID=A3IM36_9CHRO|nr:fasciclin domain-containing protein [Crocosphaera chwakensis]EAZ92492.1 fasciclin domain protein [Crocosphaera chwakensis CCY0110]
MIKQLNLTKGLKSFAVFLGVLLALGVSVSPAVAEKMEVEESQTETEVMDKEEDDEMSETMMERETDMTDDEMSAPIEDTEEEVQLETEVMDKEEDDEMSETMMEKETDMDDDEMSAPIENKETNMDDEEMSMEKEGDTAEMNLVETAMAAGEFNTLVAAVQAAGLAETLSGEQEFTVFAPTDEAFAALGEDTLEELLKPENKDKLTAILTYHVVPGMVTSTDLEAGKVKTVQGSDLEVDLGEAVMVDDATVVKADIMTSNGVIHVIDKVILPAE